MKSLNIFQDKLLVILKIIRVKIKVILNKNILNNTNMINIQQE